MKHKFIISLFITTIFLNGCSNGTNITGLGSSSSAVRVSVLGGSPLPQVAESARSVNTGRLKIYVMDNDDPYRGNVVQEVDANYRVPTVAEGKRIRVASIGNTKKPVARSARQPSVKKPKTIKSTIPAIREVRTPEPPKVQRYIGSNSSKVVTLPPDKPLSQKPVSQQPRQKESTALRDYKAAIHKLNNQKVARYKPKNKPIKKRRKKRAYNYFKGKAKNKKPVHKRNKQNKRKSKWKWDSEGRLLRVSA